MLGDAARRWRRLRAPALTSRMENHRNLSVLEEAEAVESEINRLIDDPSQRLIHTTQMRRSAHSIVANISETFGRGPDGGRAQSLRVARGEAEG